LNFKKNIIFLIFFSCFNQSPHIYPVYYWIWAGIKRSDAGQGSYFYLYQGCFNKENYTKLGLYPYPLKAKKIFLTYRLNSIKDPEKVLKIFKKDTKAWRRHGVKINGLQIDFDCPTAKLFLYANFLKKIKKSLKSKSCLSITGLLDWAQKKDQTKEIMQWTDEIVFQLYQGRKMLSNCNSYLAQLENYPFSFKVGILFIYDKH
jgi:hypothetical protein